MSKKKKRGGGSSHTASNGASNGASDSTALNPTNGGVSKSSRRRRKNANHAALTLPLAEALKSMAAETAGTGLAGIKVEAVGNGNGEVRASSIGAGNGVKRGSAAGEVAKTPKRIKFSDDDDEEDDDGVANGDHNDDDDPPANGPADYAEMEEGEYGQNGQPQEEQGWEEVEGAHKASSRIDGWDITNMPRNMRKYWNQRFSLFSKFDEGIKMDLEGWFSVTPETIAHHIAARLPTTTTTIIDAFCGVGGNTIQFALCHPTARVIAIDLDPGRIECARHNAGLYGVEERIEFVTGDFMELAGRLKADVVFLSPPWGGPEYLKAEVFDLRTGMAIDGAEIFATARRITPNVIYYMPRNSSLTQLANLAGKDERCEIEKVHLNDREKVLVAYYGDLASKE
ncbi:Trimethylguanosine synthase [Irineochytrium annulatum]|nr:Trimethylguanosine synthase [Irineochytrium annulatum]